MLGEAAHLRAIALRADYSNLSQHGHLLMRAGRTAAALKQYELAEAAEPLIGPEGFRLYIALAQERFDDAREALAWAPPGRASERRLLILLNERDTDGIAAWVETLPLAEISRRVLFLPVMEVFQSPEAVLSKLREVYADDSSRWPSKLHDIALLAAYFGDPEFALQTIGEEVRYTGVRQGALWLPVMSDVRRLTEFKQLVTDLNLVDYWRASGWADLCQPLGDDDFECN